MVRVLLFNKLLAVLDDKAIHTELNFFVYQGLLESILKLHAVQTNVQLIVELAQNFV